MSRKDQAPASSAAPREAAGPGRRQFLRTAGMVGLGAAAAPLVAAPAEARESPGEQVKGRYQLTDHVQRFYFLNSL
ncbi:hypothetical protein [Arenibaculum sp.]|jgi:hypothetical protein|uniref:hypothetical protein n=1 Tax=Arenibaculum sp. TaxID=2865862 RepID=UPI002E1349EA|nr:hypothetical protein [Arenibaculum sp.]